LGDDRFRSSSPYYPPAARSGVDLDKRFVALDQEAIAGLVASESGPAAEESAPTQPLLEQMLAVFQNMRYSF